MAETITEHIPLAASPSLDLTTHESLGEHHYAVAGLDGFDDSEFPFAPGFINGVKCCSKCGATKTPQWREGPFGPKTLCNACGVKRTRKLRAEQDGTKRRKVTNPNTNVASPVKPTKAARPTYSQDSLGAWDEPYEAPYHPTPSTQRRPLRRAAEEAAVKTARYARTGEWAGAAAAAGGSLHHQGSGIIPDLFAVFPPAIRGGAPGASPASSDLSLPSSDCPEEVSWTPLAAEAAARSGLPGMPLDCYAAVNLMTMSRSSQEGGDASPSSVAPLRAAATTTATASPPLSREDMEATLAKMDAPHGGKLTSEDLSNLYKAVPPAKVAELVRLNQELDAAMSDAQAANAAVAAVAAVLAAKQGAALRGREQVVSAAKRLRRFMQELDAQFGVNPKTLPRIRTSPKKTPTIGAGVGLATLPALPVGGLVLPSAPSL